MNSVVIQTSSAGDLHMQVTQPTGHGVAQLQRLGGVQGMDLQIVIERAVLMVVCDEVQLRP